MSFPSDLADGISLSGISHCWLLAAAAPAALPSERSLWKRRSLDWEFWRWSQRHMVSEFVNMPEPGWQKDTYQKLEKASVKNAQFHVHFYYTLPVFTQKPLIQESEVYYYQSQKQQTKMLRFYVQCFSLRVLPLLQAAVVILLANGVFGNMLIIWQCCNIRKISASQLRNSHNNTMGHIFLCTCLNIDAGVPAATGDCTFCAEQDTNPWRKWQDHR